VRSVVYITLFVRRVPAVFAGFDSMFAVDVEVPAL